MESSGLEVEILDRLQNGMGILLRLFFPTVIKSVYAYGSPDGSEIHLSRAIELLIVLHSEVTHDALNRLEDTLRACSLLSFISINANAVEETDLADFGAALIPNEAVLVLGEDLRPMLAHPTADFVAATLMHMAFATIASLYPGSGSLSHPLAPAQSDDPWLGFGQRQDSSRDGPFILNFKRLATLIIRIVQGLLAARTGRMIHPKGDRLAIEFRKHLEGNWADYVDMVFQKCQQKCGQEVLARDEDLRLLRPLCQDAYKFADWFLIEYRAFLVADLQHSDEARRRLARRNIVLLPFPPDRA